MRKAHITCGGWRRWMGSDPSMDGLEGNLPVLSLILSPFQYFSFPPWAPGMWTVGHRICTQRVHRLVEKQYNEPE